MMEKLDIKLLFVEDDTIIRNVYKQILKQFVDDSEKVIFNK